ncbi:hypothetical protein [Kitasatospora sp. NPDC086791]|uniref:hypothetical protein n=1 Tax=Kitasatospora sp. NPDC086791 TaxID=3155178 RepID=UPI00341A3CF1
MPGMDGYPLADQVERPDIEVALVTLAELWDRHGAQRLDPDGILSERQEEAVEFVVAAWRETPDYQP